MKYVKVISLVLTVLLLPALSIVPVTSAALSPSPAPLTPDGAIAELQAQAGDTLQVAYNDSTGKVSFLMTDPQYPISQYGLLTKNATPEAAARQFLSRYGTIFGLQNPDQELAVLRQTNPEKGSTFVRFQQMAGDPAVKQVPVLGGELIVQLDGSNGVISTNGKILPSLNGDLTPGLTTDQAQETALSTVRGKSLDMPAGQLTAAVQQLAIYNPVLFEAPGPRMNHLVWEVEVTSSSQLEPIDELLFVDAHSGIIAARIDQLETAKFRKIYDDQNVNYGQIPGPNLIRSEGQTPSTVGDVNKAYDYAGATYDFYWNNFNRDSVDNAGMNLVSTVRYCPSAGSCPYQNAFWNGRQMVYGDGYASADDVVGHEMTHGVTQFESHLFYFYQSGAINESLSDVFGELIDLTDGLGNDTAAVRWLLGEDLPAAVGVVRNMKNPPALGDPDKMSSANYTCSASDNGGVHTNSGINNKAAYLMTDGDRFNGKTVTGIGITKVAHLYYYAQTNLITSSTSYPDLYNILQASCSALKNQGAMTASDCQQVKNALDAVEMNAQPASCAISSAPVCPAGQSPKYLYSNNLENLNTASWTSGILAGSVNDWFYPQNPNGVNLDATYATSGQYNLWGYDYGLSVVNTPADYYMAMSGNVALAAATTPYLRFNHAYAFDSYIGTYYDGGVLEYTTNNGSSWIDAGSLITHNGYGGVISSSYSNPLGGRSAFVDASSGYISTRLNLSSLAGQNVRFRFRIGVDDSVDNYGWFIDDISIYTCSAVTAAHVVRLPLLMKGLDFGAPGLYTGYWSGSGFSHYVTADRGFVKNFAVIFKVDPCGTYQITHTTSEPIASKAFSFTGSYSASGHFDSISTASGTAQLTNFNINGCGPVNGGPWAFATQWQNGLQPATLTANLSNPEAIGPAAPQESDVTVTRIK